MDANFPPPPPGPPTIPPRPPFGPPQFRVPQRPPSKVTSGKAIGAFVLGLFSFFFWVVTAVPALILALLARSDIKRDPERVSGSGLALAGALLALLGLFLPPLAVFLIASAMPGYGIERFSSGPRLAHIHLSGPLVEMTTFQDPFGLFAPQSLSLVDLLRAMNNAENDEDVKGIVFTADNFQFGASQREELIAAFDSLKTAGKDIFVHTTTLDTQSYALFAHATHLSMAPTDILFLTGLYGEAVYIKDALDALNAEVQVIHIGDFKSAGETFTRSEPSPAAEANQNWIMDNLYLNLVESIARARSMEPDNLRSLIDGGPYTVEEARDLGLVDSVQFVDEFVDSTLTAHAGAEIDDRYFQRLSQAWQQNFAPFADFTNGQGSGSSSNPIVGIITIEGAILPGYGGDNAIGADPTAYGDVLRKIIDDAAENDDVAAVVVRVNSPGGSVTASEVILRALTNLQEEKPVVVSMGDVAASGGYYVACKADYIFADPSTITGSIGVVGGKLIIGGTLTELGINWHPYGRGANADILSSSAPFNEPQIERIRSSMEYAYGIFQGHVLDGRGDKLTEPIDQLSGGRVYTGVQALEKGLVDKMGSLQDAVQYAAELAQLSEYNVQPLPQQLDFWTLFFEDMSGGGERPSDLQALAAGTLQQLLGSGFSSEAQWFAQIEPGRTRELIRIFTALHLLQREGFMALDPQLLTVN